MRSFNSQVEGLNERKEKRRKARIAELLLAVLVIGAVAGILSQYGVAMTDVEKCGLAEHKHNGACYENTLICGMEESEGHQHTDECYETANILSCGLDETEGHQHDESCYDEAGNLICGKKEMESHHHTDDCYTQERTLVCGQKEEEGHTHTDACYEQKLICGMEEHAHIEECYIDKGVDVEEPSKWDDMYANTEWRDTWNENLVIAARKQIGYRESKDNYEVAEDGSHKGYTRYGDFCEDDYCDWDAAFVNFCMHYAGKDEANIEASKMFPAETDTEKWREEFIKADENNESLLMKPEDYEPKAGDLIFFDGKGEETPVRMGIVSSYDVEKNEIKIIEGNSTDEVKENTYKIKEDTEDLFGGNLLEQDAVVTYLNMAAAEEAYQASLEAAAQNQEEEIRELTTEVDDTVITLSGPISSFEEGKEYTLQAEKVENEETIATVEEAIDQVAEEKGATVDSYQAFDIKLMLDGEEVQPLGPVAVKFSGKEIVKSVENEETEVNVIHVDENTGETTDMEAVSTEESDVVIETEHFSVYVYIELTGIEGAKVDIQHWGENILTVDAGYVGYNRGEKQPSEISDAEAFKEPAFNLGTKSVATTSGAFQLYTTDKDFHLPLETYIDVRELSKVRMANNAGYKISKIWVSNDESQCAEDATEWPEDSYVEYLADQLKDDQVPDDAFKEGNITDKELEDLGRIEIRDLLKEGSVIRFWYEPVDGGEKQEPVTFYDYDISDGNYCAEEKGINNPDNFLYKDGRPKFGIGQSGGAGNLSSWALPANNKDMYNGVHLNSGNRDSDAKVQVAKVVKDIVRGQLSSDGTLQFSEKINAPTNLFSNDPDHGSTQYDGYHLGFSQKGDTYTLESVYNAAGTKVLSNLTTFKDRFNYRKTAYIFSNEFWPLDNVQGKDPLLGSNPAVVFKDNNGKTQECNNWSDFPVDNPKAHNWYFGMAYQMEFTVGDYTGPMQYYFRGDDDFWLYLDGELVVDLGGIHAAVGEPCDIRKILEDKVESGEKTEAWLKGKHTLKVFYMERGASGSCCYMQFTLPKAEIQPLPTPNTTTYTVEKRWEDNENGFRPHDIKVTLYKKKEGEAASGVAIATVNLPLKNEEGKYIDADGKLTDTPVWSYTWSLPEKDGMTDRKNIYYAEEERIDPTNESNPMLGYTCTREESPDKTKITITNTIEDKKIKVVKEWSGGIDEQVNRPKEVTFRLYANGEVYKKLNGETVDFVLNKDNKWMAECDHLPEYYYDTSGSGDTSDNETDAEESAADATDSAESGFDNIAGEETGGDAIAGGNVEDDEIGNDTSNRDSTDGGESESSGSGSEESDDAGGGSKPVGVWRKVKYSVVEISNTTEKGEFSASSGAIYDVDVSEVASGDAIEAKYIDMEEAGKYIAVFKATNTLISKNVCIEKVSKNIPTTTLSGAAFNLYRVEDFKAEESGDNGNVSPEGISLDDLKKNVTPQAIITGENGRIDIKGLRFGTYYLVETKAPEGYFLSEMPIRIVVNKDGVTVDFQRDDWQNWLGGEYVSFDPEEGKYTIQIPNEIIYELPEAGGNGIYLYMFGGVLLMLAASLLAYKNKRKEVLRS